MEARQKLRDDEERVEGRPLDIDEVRLVADLRVMHAKVDELFEIVTRLKQRHPESDVRRYADQNALETDIHQVDQIYLWFVGLKQP